MTNEQYIETARKQYQREGEIEVDDNALVSRGSDPGAYVAAWVWVRDEALEEKGWGSEWEEDEQ